MNQLPVIYGFQKVAEFLSFPNVLIGNPLGMKVD